MKKISIAVLIALALSGCVTVPKQIDDVYFLVNNVCHFVDYRFIKNDDKMPRLTIPSAWCHPSRV